MSEWSSAAVRRERALAGTRPYVERARSFSGWAFADLDVRHLDDEPPWDYEAIAREYASRARRVLDLGTGGGERLSAIAVGSPARFVATEEWHVNTPVAHRRLHPMGIDVVRAASTRPPFAPDSFDLILDRHEALDPAATAALLALAGTLVTQQCGHDNWREVQDAFGDRASRFDDHERTYAGGFAAAGLVIERRERHEYRVAFGSLGVLVFLLMTAPWTVPDFHPEDDIDLLLDIEQRLGGDQGIVVTETRYLIIARR